MIQINKILNLYVRFYRKSKLLFLIPFWKLKTILVFRAFHVIYSDFATLGTPFIGVYKEGRIKIGCNFRMNNDFAGNVIGRQQKCIFIADMGEIIIGENVGISSTAIISHKKIIIGDNVRIGGNCVIYDTDFHSIDLKQRTQKPENKQSIGFAPVIINQNVFIGAHVTILKGVMIGENSIVGAGSVVTKDIPANEIWGGNPIKFIKKI